MHWVYVDEWVSVSPIATPTHGLGINLTKVAFLWIPTQISLNIYHNFTAPATHLQRSIPRRTLINPLVLSGTRLAPALLQLTML